MHVFKPRCKSPDLDAAKHRNQNIRLSFRTTGHVGEAKRIEIGLTIGIDTCLWSLLSWLTAKHQTTAQVPIGLQLSILCVGQPSLGRTEVSTLGRLFDEIALKIQSAPVTKKKQNNPNDIRMSCSQDAVKSEVRLKSCRPRLMKGWQRWLGGLCL